MSPQQQRRGLRRPAFLGRVGILSVALGALVAGALVLPASAGAHLVKEPRAGTQALLTGYSLERNPGSQSATLRWCVADARTSNVTLIFGYRGWEDMNSIGYKQFLEIDNDGAGKNRCVSKDVTWDATVPTGYVRVAGTAGVRVTGFGEFPKKNEYGYLGSWVVDSNVPGSAPYFIGNTCTWADSDWAGERCDLPFDLGQGFWIGPILRPSSPQFLTQSAPSANELTWYSPQSLGGAATVSYVVEYQTAGGAWTGLGTTTTTRYDVSSVGHGRNTFRVAAVNDAGSGPWSNEFSLNVSGPPEPPTSVTGEPGDESAVVSWAGGDDGGLPILGYSVAATPGGSTCSTTGSLSCTVTGLTNGVAYTFAVTSINAAGTSLPSNASAPITPRTVPAPPGRPSGMAGVKQIVVSWSAPVTDGGSRILGYTATATPGGGSCSTTGELSCVITRLDADRPYSLTVIARNAAGSSLPSEPSDVVTPAAPLSKPGKVTSLRVKVEKGRLRVKWSPPTNLGGATSVAYQCKVGRTAWQTTTSTSVTVRASKGASVVVKVRAFNEAGYGPSSRVSGTAR